MNLSVETVKTLLDFMTGIPIVEFYANTLEEYKRNNYFFENCSFWTDNKDDAIGYLFDKVELYNWRVWKITSQLGGGADKLVIYLIKGDNIQ